MSSRRVIVTPSGPFGFSYDDFAEWYETSKSSLLDPARQTFERLLSDAFQRELSDLDRNRVRVSSSRIKNPIRLWRKMQLPAYASQINDMSDIPEVIDDLVGIRVTCNNLSDITIVEGILANLPFTAGDSQAAGISIEPDTERKYVERPKESGYRAYHINLVTLVPGIEGWSRARGELQVRTLLQDGWGELTHEDTYKPGAGLPRMAQKLARRMADLLATVDDLAQDLRDELDVLASKDVEGVAVADVSSTTSARLQQSLPGSKGTLKDQRISKESSDLREALVSEARRVVGQLTKPASLAQVAQEVQSNFGPVAVSGWGGFGSFKELLKTAVPNYVITANAPGFIVPPGMSPPALSPEVLDDQPDIPSVLKKLRAYDKKAPLLPAEQLSKLVDIIMEALLPSTWAELHLSNDKLGLREINLLASRSRARFGDVTFSLRSPLEYMLKALLFSQNLRPGLEREEVLTILADWLFWRAAKFGLIADAKNDQADLKAWLMSANPRA